MARPRRWSPQARVLLAALVASRGEWSHGYDLSKQTGLKAGTLYPLLMRLSDQRLLDAEWRDPQQPGRPPRHVYRLTPHGRAVARELTGPAASALKRRLSDPRRLRSALSTAAR